MHMVHCRIRHAISEDARRVPGKIIDILAGARPVFMSCSSTRKPRIENAARGGGSVCVANAELWGVGGT
jgi:hypothetical protein